MYLFGGLEAGLVHAILRRESIFEWIPIEIRRSWRGPSEYSRVKAMTFAG